MRGQYVPLASNPFINVYDMSRGTYVNTLTHRNELISMYAENQIFYARRKKIFKNLIINL